MDNEQRREITEGKRSKRDEWTMSKGEKLPKEREAREMNGQ